MLAVPANTLRRDGEPAPPPSRGQGRPPKRPGQRVTQWAASLGDEAWGRVDVRDGAKGPLVVDVVTRRGLPRTHRRHQGDEELLVVLRYRARDPERVVQGAYSLSNAAPETPLPELARVAKAAHRIAACIQRSKSAAGLADYEVRHWAGWQQHPTLSLLATGCLERETHRGEKMDAGAHLPTDSPGHCDDRARGVSVWHAVAYAGPTPKALAT